MPSVSLSQIDTGIGGGGGGGAVAGITVDQTVNPDEILWGKTSFISAIASGGQAPYTYSHSIGCKNKVLPVLPIAADPNGIVNHTHQGTIVGLFQATTYAVDAVGVEGSDADDLTVLAPDTVELKSGHESVDLTGVADGTVVNFTFDFIFEVRRGQEKVGPFADGLAQEKTLEAEYDPVQMKWIPKPGEQWTNWLPEDGNGAPNSGSFYFHSPEIHDQKSVGVTVANWNNVPVNTIILHRFQKVRQNFPTCDGTSAIESPEYLLIITKINATQIRIVHTLQ